MNHEQWGWKTLLYTMTYLNLLIEREEDLINELESENLQGVNAYLKTSSSVGPLYKNSIGSQKSILIRQVFLFKGNLLF
jgi:hypothetical protein